MITKEFTITAEVGLHARLATKLIQEASRYDSHIELQFGNKKVNVKSIMGVMSLGLAQGTTFSMNIEGHDEEKAMEGIESLFTSEGIAD